MSFNLMYLLSLLRMPTKVSKVLQGSELTITPIVDSFLETSYSWQINGEDISNELNSVLSHNRAMNIKFVLLLTMKMAMTK